MRPQLLKSELWQFLVPRSTLDGRNLCPGSAALIRRSRSAANSATAEEHDWEIDALLWRNCVHHESK